VVLTLVATPAFAQSLFQTPTGHQTIGSSQMPQFPTAREQIGPETGRMQRFGNLEFPMGISSGAVTGPPGHITLTQRALMAAWLLLQFVVVSVVAVALFVNNMRDRVKYQGGHAIREGYHDPLRKGV
jgi:hypothetical protein